MSPEEIKKQEQISAEVTESPEFKTATLEELKSATDANIAATSEEFIQSLEKAKESPSFPEDVSLALGELKLDAKAVALETKEEIEAVVNGEDHEIYEGLSDPEKLESVDIESLHDQAKGLRRAQRKFNKAFGKVSGIKDKKQRAQEAVSFTQQKGFEADSLSAEQLAQ